MLKTIFVGFLSRYFEEIELTLSFFAAEYCAMAGECWRHYPKSIAPHYNYLYSLKQAVTTVKLTTKIALNTRFVV